MHNYYWRRAIGFMSIFILPIILNGQCPENIRVTGNNRLKLEFKHPPNQKPSHLILNEQEIWLSPIGNVSNYMTDSDLNNEQAITEFALYYSDTKNQCSYNREGSYIKPDLAVALLNFEGELIDECVELIWSTNNQIEKEGFEVEQSFDGKQFENIDFIEGNEYADNTQYYRYSDQSIDFITSEDIIYYRLVQLDYDGSRNYSDLMAVNLSLENTAFEISKVSGLNAVDQSINVYYQVPENLEQIDFLLADAKGQTLGTRTVYPKLGKNMLKLDLRGYQGDTFSLLASDGEKIISRKIAISN